MKFVLDKELKSKGKLQTRFTVSPKGATVFLLSPCCVTAGKSCPWLGIPSGQYPAALCGHPGPPNSEAGLRTLMLITSDAHLPISKMCTAQPAFGSEEESPFRTFCKAQCRPCSCAGPALLSHPVFGACWPVAGGSKFHVHTGYSHLQIPYLTPRGQTGRGIRALSPLLCPHKAASILVV